MYKHVTIDSKLIKANQYPHAISYYLYHRKEADDVSPLDFDNNEHVENKKDIHYHRDICFARLLRQLRTNMDKKWNRLLYMLIDVKVAEKLSDHDKARWVEIAKANKSLPEYITGNMATSNKIVFKIPRKSPSLLYVYLTSARAQQEHPGFVRAIIHFVDHYNIPFTVAWAIASKIAITNTWHNIMSLSRPYGNSRKDVNDLEIPLELAIGFKTYLENPDKYDGREISALGDSSTFEAEKRISKICTTSWPCYVRDLNKQCVKRALRTSVHKDLAALQRKYKEMTKNCKAAKSNAQYPR